LVNIYLAHLEINVLKTQQNKSYSRCKIMGHWYPQLWAQKEV